ncbi:MAG: hypothetical protein AAF389_01255 [Gemmatimonadota bacterium]
MNRASWLAVAWLTVAACSEAAVESTVTVVDSSGVAIVTHASLEAPLWPTSEAPVLELGSVDGEGPESFFRISSAVQLASGELAVFNSGSGELRFFGADGSYLRTLGARGEGPGEYAGAVRLRRLAGDTLALWDSRQPRMTTLAPDGEVVRTATPEGIGRRPVLISVLSDGGMFFEQEIVLRIPAPTELTQLYANYIVWNADGSVRDSLPVQENHQVIRWGEGPLAGPPTFGVVTEFAGDESGYWVGTQKTEEIVRYSMVGTEALRLRWTGPDRATTSADSDLFLEDVLPTLPNDDARQQRREMHAGTMVSPVFPSHGQLLMDRPGNLWVQEYERPGRSEPSRWFVFDREGMLVGRVELPRGLRMFEIGDDYVLAQRNDDLGIEYIVRYALDRIEVR